MGCVFSYLRWGWWPFRASCDRDRGFLHRLRGISRSSYLSGWGGNKWGDGRWELPRFGGARKAEALRADSLDVRHNIAALLFIPLFSLTGWCAEPGTVIQKRVSEVQLMVVATDQNDRPLATLSPADITVLEDGQPVPRFELRTGTDLGLRVAIVIDLSDSTRRSWTTVRAALARSMREVIRPEDELLVLTFNSSIELERRVADPADLEAVLADPGSGGLTALYDAIYQACGRPVFASDGKPHRSALILFSDGEDDLSLHGMEDAIARAERAGVAIYTITTHSPKKKTNGDAVLHNLAEATGGRDFIVKDQAQLDSALSEIDGELRTSYLLYYRASEQPGLRTFRRVHVIPSVGGRARVRSRSGYFTAP